MRAAAAAFNGQAVGQHQPHPARPRSISAPARLSANGDPLLFPGRIEIEAWNNYSANQASDGSRRHIRAGGAKGILGSNISNTINIGQNVLFSVGRSRSARAVADINSSVRAEM